MPDRTDNPTPDKSPAPAGEKASPYRLKPSRNQKQRSRLNQVPEEQSAPEPIEQPQPAPRPTAPAPVVRKMKLKRSGQSHEDLTDPDVGATPRRDDEY